MTHDQSDALTLRSYPYSETHLIVIFLTRNNGQLRSIAYGAKGGKNRRFGSGLEPLTYSRITYSSKEGQELVVLRDLEIINAYPAYELAWEKKLHFAYFSELLQEFTSEGKPSEESFRLILAVLNSSGGIPIAILSRYFELWMLRLEGILPDLDTKLPKKLASKTHSYMATPPHKLDSQGLELGELERLGRFSEELIESHLEKKLKSRKILKEIL